MNIETNKQINHEIQAYQLKQYTILEKIQEQLLENNKLTKIKNKNCFVIPLCLGFQIYKMKEK